VVGTMSLELPSYLSVPPDQLGEGTNVRVRVVADPAELARAMARDMAAVIRQAALAGKPATLIVPVGPVDQFPVLARLVNSERLSLADVMFINMDEYLDDSSQWVDADHPLSFRGYMQRAFYDLIEPELAPKLENRVFPDPADLRAIGEGISARGGVDACFGGIGINGHMAFNEPPHPGEKMSPERFAALPTRILPLACETRTINSVTVGGELSVIPRMAITVGMREILAARRLCFYGNRPWQSAVVRRVLHGPVTPDCPASLMRTHADALLTITETVAALPDIRLR
jgi:glucosamine-6-phosphate deaminase